MQEKIEVFIRREPAYALDAVYVRVGDKMLKQCKFETLQRHGAIADPLRDAFWPERGTDFLQAVMDAAWEYGLRPSAFKDHEAAYDAQTRHLEDMRALVFKNPKPRS